MKKTVLILLTFGLTQAIFCQKTTHQKLDELLTAYTNLYKFNGSVLVAQKGKVILEKGYGIKNAAANSKNDKHSLFQIYSVTKTFTSTVILKLVEQGKLSLSDKLSKFYPSFPKGDSITIEHLLTHTSGLYEYTHGGDIGKGEKSFVDFLATKPLDFSPGTNWSYCNSGYWLLGFIIQKITGLTYENAVRKYIFKPLHMNNSGFDFKPLVNKNKTTGYEVYTEAVKKEAIIYDPPGPYAAGAIYSTVGDLLNYHEALQSFKLLGKGTLQKAYTPFKNNYGYGWIINTYDNKQSVSHSGGAAGYRSNFERIPEEDICIVILSNTESSNVQSITRKLLDVLHNKPYTIPFAIKLPKETLKQYTGTYQFTKRSLILYVTIEDGNLVAQPARQPKNSLLAQKENYFYSLEADAYLEFNKDSLKKIILTQRGEQLEGYKIYPSWGLLGSAATNGWDGKNDIQFTQDVTKKGLWKLSDVRLVAGEIKFRFNNDWTINYGDNNNDNQLDTFGNNIKVEAGTYDIVLDFSNETMPRYSIMKKQ